MKEDVLMITLNGITFSQREAEKIVGGRARLTRLVGEGRIRMEKRANRQNGKWYCNAFDCVIYAQ
jgi:hypothetical protein